MNDNGNKATATASGIGTCGLLGVAFVILKLCGVIDWPWIWVLAPFWGGFLLGVLVFVLFLIFAIWLMK
ncbi:MAG: hypothetical protein IKS26_04860 [Paludibacteraceae bacterium]|nr:hypothetical protein [Paludibacteraceae bacterium]